MTETINVRLGGQSIQVRIDNQVIASQAIAARDLAQQYASDAAGVSGVNVPSYASRASLGGETVAAAIKQIGTRGYATEGDGGDGDYVRTSYATIVAAGYPAQAYQRSVDRIMPDGTTDATNGGYWLITGPSLSVEAFGWTGAVSATDIAALQAAHDALPSAGGTITFPRGTSTWNAGVVLTKTVRLVGHGCSVTAGGVAPTQIYKGAGVATAAITLLGLGSSIENMGFQGVAGNTGPGVQVSAGRVSLRRVSSHRMGGDGIKFGDASSSNCNLFRCDQIFTRENGRHGGYFHDDGAYAAGAGPNVNGGLIGLWESASNGGDGVKLYMCWYNTVVGFVPQVNTGYGLNIVNDGVSPTYLGSRFHTIVGGEQDEGNGAGNINNSGYQCNFFGVTPGSTFSDTGVKTQVVAQGFNKLAGLTVTSSPVTAELSSGTTTYPVVARNYGNSSNGRGVGYEFQVPNGATPRVGARIAAEQETANKDYLSFLVNISGVLTELLRLAPNASAIRPGPDGTLSLGLVGAKWANVVSTKYSDAAGIKLLGAQGLAVADATDATTAITQLNALLARCRAHGLIAT